MTYDSEVLVSTPVKRAKLGPVNPMEEIPHLQKGQQDGGARLRPPTLPRQVTNDGTHRLTFKWSTNDRAKMERLEQDKKFLDEEVHSLLSMVLTDADGTFYRW
jgi:hypothetical protein